MVQEGSDKGDDGEVLIVSTSSSIDAWIFDFGESYYMTYNHDWLDSFKDWNDTIKMGDDRVRSIKGSGNCRNQDG